MHVRPNEAIDQLIAAKIQALKNVQKFFRNQGNMEATLAVLREFPDIPVEENPRDNLIQQPQPIWGTGLKAAVLNALPSVRGDFSYVNVHAVMLQNRYEFKNLDRRNAINGVLRQLVAQGSLIEVTTGKSSRPTIYRHAGNQ